MDKIKQLQRSSTRLYNRLRQKENTSIEFTTAVKIDRRSISWTIENVYKSPTNAGEYIESPVFSTGSYDITKWRLRFYPKGKSTEDLAPKKEASLYLCKITPATKIHVEVKLFTKNIEGVTYCNGSNQICEKDDEIGSDKMIPRERLECLDNLVIGCELKVGYLPEKDDRNYESDSCNVSCPCAMSSDFEKLYNSSQFTDVVLQVGKKQFNVHKAVLAARSEVFFAMFEHEMAEKKTDIVTIENIEPSVMVSVLQHIYTGKMDNIDTDKAILLYPVADRYFLKELKKECTNILLENLSVGNVCRIAVLADLHSVDKLRDASTHFIRNYSAQVFDRGEWDTLAAEKPKLAANILKDIVKTYKTNCAEKK